VAQHRPARPLARIDTLPRARRVIPPTSPVPRVLRFLLIVALAAAALPLLLVLLAWAQQERLVWQPPPAFPSAAGDTAARRVDYVAEDGQPLFGVLVTPPAPAAPAAPAARAAPARVLLAFHGNAEVAAHSVPWAREVARRTGWAVLLAEYRGYAGLPGSPSYEGARRDARAAYRWLRDSLGVPADGVGIYGFSLGTAVASELAAEATPRVLVLQAPFTSARDMARAVGSWPVAAAWPLIGRVRFDTRARVAAVDAPVWVLHGAADPVIPVWMGRAVHAAARRPGELLVVPGAGHNDLEPAAGPRYWAFLTAALADGEQ
jgi:pimeloyl-ACP methyl ester carboxylesterase